MDFWNNVKIELSFQGLTQKDLANKADLNYRTLQNWIARNIQPDVFAAVKIAKSLNVSAEYLLFGTVQKNELSQDDKSLLNEYHKLSDHDKKVLKTIISTMTKISDEISPDNTNYVIVK